MSTPLQLRGDLPDYIVQGITRDDNGIFAGTVLRPYQVGPKNQRISLDWLDPQKAPDPGWRIPCVSAAASIVDAGICNVVYSYKGADPDKGDNQFQEQDVTFELDTSMNEDKIETHPAFKELRTMYGWDDTNRRFSETLPLAGPKFDVKNGLSAEGNAGEVENPLFGTDSWLVIAAVYRMTYGRRSIPGSILDDIGTIVKRPPNIQQFKIPSGEGRNWLKLAPKLQKQGNAVRITEEWALSGPKGWLKQIYSQGQLRK